jgi:prephenate dehydrogenase
MTVAAPAVGKLVVVGVGLIGGSCALALKGRGAVREVVGVGRTQRNLDEALALGIVDRASTLDSDWAGELANADVVLVAAPVRQFGSLLPRIAAGIGPSTVVTDAGSTKQDVVAVARESFGAALPRFVPGHPIAGTENSGAAAAVATLYEGRTVILTPLEATSPSAVAKVRAMWQACGARLRELDAHRHDAIYAAVSHLPHLLAFAFVDSLCERADGAEYLQLAGGGFRDFTRIAASSPEMWRDIFLANRDAIRLEMDRYREVLDRYEAAMRNDDPAALDALIEASRRARRAWTAWHGASTADSPIP